jgi:Polysaccharide pyruvyl transferase
MTRVSIITTVNHNVGDDFVREGILYLLSKKFGKIQPKLIHKHLPITARPEFGWFRRYQLDKWLDRYHPNGALKVTGRIDRMLPIFPWSDRVKACDMLVQSGAPVYWAHPDGDCQNNEWWKPLIERRWVGAAQGRPFYNLAGGTCQRWGSDGSEFASKPETLDYIRRFYDLTTATSVRDQLSVKVVALAGRKVEAIPCSSIFAVDGLGIAPRKGEYVVVNYMKGGGHYTFGQEIDAKKWDETFVKFVDDLSQRMRVVVACHDQKEVNGIKWLFKKAEIFFSHDYIDYLKFYASARFGIMNRVHGAFAIASLGKPAVVVGTDSRAEMTNMIGLPSVFVSSATREWLDRQVELLENSVDSFPAEMARRKTEAEKNYLRLLSTKPNS